MERRHRVVLGESVRLRLARGPTDRPSLFYRESPLCSVHSVSLYERTRFRAAADHSSL